MAFAFTPSNASSVAVQLGIAHTLSGCILENENIESSVDLFDVTDQANRVAQQIAYQKKYNFSFTAVGSGATPPTTAGASFIWNNPETGSTYTYYIDSVKLVTSKSDVAKWDIAGHAFAQTIAFQDSTDSSLP